MTVLECPRLIRPPGRWAGSFCDKTNRSLVRLVIVFPRGGSHEDDHHADGRRAVGQFSAGRFGRATGGRARERTRGAAAEVGRHLEGPKWMCRKLLVPCGRDLRG